MHVEISKLRSCLFMFPILSFVYVGHIIQFITFAFVPNPYLWQIANIIYSYSRLTK